MTSTQPSSPSGLSENYGLPLPPLQTPPVTRSMAAHYSEQDEKRLHEVSISHHQKNRQRLD